MLTTILLPMLAMSPGIAARSIKREGVFGAADLIQIAPTTQSCAGSVAYPECANAYDAAPNMAHSFWQFHIDSFGAQAALVAIVLFETADLKYNHNHFPAPGVPGQGTRNMQSPAFNEKYAEYIAANGLSSSITMAKVSSAKAYGPDAVLALVNDNEWGFASAAWFLATQCPASVKEALADCTQASFESYLTTCVGTTATADRITGWQAVVGKKQWTGSF